MIQFDPTKLAEYGVGIVALIVVYLLTSAFFKVWSRSIDTQEKSNEALNRNSDAYTKLSSIFEKSHEREMEFQKESREFHLDTLVLLRDTNEKVDFIHKQTLEKTTEERENHGE